MPKDRTGQANWQRRPEDDEVGIRYPLWRVSANRTHRVIVLSHDLIGCHTHYFGGRTSPCEIEDCSACLANCARRWHAWLFTKLLDSPAIGILELTAKATGPVDQYFRAHRTLIGAQMTLCRSPKKPNGKVICALQDIGLDQSSLPKVPDVRDILTQMWELSARRQTKQQAAPPMHPNQPSTNGQTEPRFEVHHD
jgi:hypothetical protein